MALSVVQFTLSLLTVLSVAFSTPLRLCHTNDFHAKYLEVGASNVKCQWWDSVHSNCYSGVARLATALDSLNCDIKIQAGDWVQGSLLDTVFQQDIAIAAYGWINYDFATFGNHEFDYGNALINDTIRQISSKTTWISSNVFFEGEGMEDLPIARWSDLHGICWVSALTAETLTLSSVEDNVRIEAEDEYMKKYMAKCSQQKNVIAITHQGYNNDLETCRNVKEIDLIIGGHSHTNLDNGQYPVKVIREDGSVCWVTQAYAHGRYVGMLDIEFDEAGAIQIKSTAYIPLDYRIERNLEVLGNVQMYNFQVSKKAGEIIGTVTDDVVGGQACRGPEIVPSDGTPVKADCSMGDLVCDSVLASGKQGADGLERVCLMNGGTLRNSFIEGDVTLRDLVNVLPFGNTIVSQKMTGQDIINALNHGFSVFGSDNKGGFPGGLGNMVVKTSVDGTKPVGEMVTIESVTVGDQELVPDQEYILMTNSYAAGGGDGYSWPGEFEDHGTMLREATQMYLGDNNPYDPVTEARIVMEGSGTDELNKKGAVPIEDNSKFMDEGVGIETELDDTLIIPVREVGSKYGQCKGDRCPA